MEIPTKKELMNILNISQATASRRLKAYKQTGDYYKLMMKNGCVSYVVLSDGRHITSDELSKIKGCNQNYACAIIRDFKAGKLTEYELLSTTRKSVKYGSCENIGSDKQRLYNLDRIPDASEWERRNII